MATEKKYLRLDPEVLLEWTYNDENLKQENYKILYFPKFIIKHFGGKSFGSKKEQKKHYYSSQDYYFQKHFGKLQYGIIKNFKKIFYW